MNENKMNKEEIKDISKNEIERIELNTLDPTFSLSIPLKTIKLLKIDGITSRLCMFNCCEKVCKSMSFDCLSIILDKVTLKKKKRKILLRNSFVSIGIKYFNGDYEVYEFPYECYQRNYVDNETVSLLVQRQDYLGDISTHLKTDNHIPYNGNLII